MELPSFTLDRPIDYLIKLNVPFGVIKANGLNETEALGIFEKLELHRLEAAGLKNLKANVLHKFFKIQLSEHPFELVNRFEETGWDWGQVLDGDQVVGYVQEKHVFALLYHSFRKDQQQMEEMKRTLKQKDEFLGILAHDLRNPLQIIELSSQYLKIARKKKKFSEQDEQAFMDRIDNNLRKANGLISSMLDLETINSDKSREVLLKETAINSVLETMICDMNFLGARKQLKFECQLSEIPKARIERVRFQQIIENLLVNAIKFSPNQSTVRVTSKKIMEKESEWIEIGIQDQGEGIPEQKLKQVFEKFTQLENPKDISELGVGLGLAIARQYVQLHYGRIEVSNTPGSGACFKVIIPASSQFKDLGGDTSQKGKDSKTVLVVDDDVDVVSFLRDTFVDAGYEVDMALNGKEALQKYHLFGYDLIVSDIRMPEMDGINLLQSVKDLNPEVNVILVSGFYPSIDTDLARAAFRIEGFFRKPFDPAELTQAVEEIFAEAETSKQAS